MKGLLPDITSAAERFVMMDSTHVMSASDNLAVNMSGYNSSFGSLLNISNKPDNAQNSDILKSILELIGIALLLSERLRRWRRISG
jgi:hypothetical protein